MDATDAMTLQAFLLALSQLDVVLPQDLHQDIQDTGIALANHQPGIADRIRELVKRHARLEELFEQSMRDLRQQYQTHDLMRGLTATSEQMMICNHWAVPLLTANDFRAVAKQLLHEVKPEIRHTSDSTRVFLFSLQKAVESLDARAIAVLKALEKRPLTVKGLVYVLGIPLEQAWAIVQTLWHQGYIERVTGHLLYKIFPMLTDRQRTRRRIDHETYLTLTAKGHFLLHPIVTLGGQKGIVW